MSIPFEQHPLFELTIPSTKKNIKVRPMLAREEKILLIAKQSGEFVDILAAVKQICQNCIIDKTVDVNTLAIFDLEFLFIRIRALSISNIIKPRYLDTEDNKEYDFSVDLNKIEVVFAKNLENKEISREIELRNNMKMIMKYPSCALLSDIEYTKIKDTEDAFDYLLKSCIECIKTSDEHHDIKNISNEELNSFIDNLSIPSYNAIKEFLLNIPRVEHTIEYTNSKGTERKILLSSLNDFFSLV